MSIFQPCFGPSTLRAKGAVSAYAFSECVAEVMLEGQDLEPFASHIEPFAIEVQRPIGEKQLAGYAKEFHLDLAQVCGAQYVLTHSALRARLVAEGFDGFIDSTETLLGEHTVVIPFSETQVRSYETQVRGYE
jgi:hypothetical protein